MVVQWPRPCFRGPGSQHRRVWGLSPSRCRKVLSCSTEKCQLTSFCSTSESRTFNDSPSPPVTKAVSGLHMGLSYQLFLSSAWGHDAMSPSQKKPHSRSRG